MAPKEAIHTGQLITQQVITPNLFVLGLILRMIMEVIIFLHVFIMLLPVVRSVYTMLIDIHTGALSNHAQAVKCCTSKYQI